MKSFSMRFPEGKNKAMTFSYDDGVKCDYRLIDLMRKYGIKGTFNINTNQYVGGDADDNHLKLDFLRQVANDPSFEIACHGHNHPYYTHMPSSAVANDIVTNRKELEGLLGQIVRGFAYPYGPCNDISEDVIKVAGIVYARLTKPTNAFDLPENWLKWYPTCHHKASLDIYDRFETATRNVGDPLVMYVWGHSYEFNEEHDNNWELIETLFQRCHKNDDIWFATNMEIYDYTNAFKQLVFSCDGNMVYNPTSMDLWAIVDSNWRVGSGKTIKIPAGQTIKVG